jgi:tetratricopeptide (TPR) repeat protein
VKTQNPDASQDASESVVFAELVEELTAKLHGSAPFDVEAYLADHPTHAERLRALLPSLRMLNDLSKSGLGSSVLPPARESAGEVPGTLGDFRLLREVGRGGMGVVYEAEQISLRRRVALKVLPFAATMDPRQLQRFKNEAQAAAQLHHTHIVPVHYVGCERGVYFYAMQFVEGHSLAAVIAGLGAASRPVVKQANQPTMDQAAGQPIPSAELDTAQMLDGLSTARSTRNAAWFRTVARLGVEAAEALDHAHQHGIVHRDVKPANLLVDAAGHLWVTDFGLAQVQSDARITISGDLIGTLRYMSPEQALAQRRLVDHRTDVYSLGATLYELLTLEPVFAGTDRQELLRQIAFEEPPPLRRRNRALPAELETIVLKTLEKVPAERYATAQDLADDLRRFLQDDPIRARRPTLGKRLARWCRRHKPLVAGVGVLLLMALLLGGVGLWWIQRLRVEVGADLREAELFQEQEHWQEALRALERASGKLTWGGPVSLRQRVDVLRRDVYLVYRLEEARLLASAATDMAFDYVGADRAYSEAFAGHGLDVTELAPQEVAERIRSLAIRTHIVAALDNWASVREKLRARSGEPLWELARLADDDEWRQQLRDPQVRRDREALERLAEKEGALDQPPVNLVLLGRALDAARGRAAAVTLLRKAYQRHPADFWISLLLAELLFRGSRTSAEAIGFSRVALALRPQSPAVHNFLGDALKVQGKLTEAEEHLRKAIELNPNYASAYGILGSTLRLQGKLARAEAAYRKSIALSPDNAWVYYHLGLALRDQDKQTEAVEEYRRAIATRPALLGPDPIAVRYHLGIALRKLGKSAEAQEAFRQASVIQPDPAEIYPAEAYASFGLVLRELGKPTEAEVAFRKAIALEPGLAWAHEQLVQLLQEQGKLVDALDAIRRSVADRLDSGETYIRLGVALRDQGMLVEAESAFRMALAIKPDLAPAHFNLGLILKMQGKPKEAEIEFLQAAAIEPDPAGPEAAWAFSSFGAALLHLERPAEAVDAFRKALAINPNLAWVQEHLGHALKDLGKAVEAAEAYRKAIDTKPSLPVSSLAVTYGNLGVVLLKQGKPAEAEDAFRKAINIDAKLAWVHVQFGHALRDQGKLAEAMEAYRQAITILPDFAEAHSNLGFMLRRQGQLAEALVELKQGHELGRRQPSWSYPSDQWVREVERLCQLDAKLPQFLSGQAKPADAAECLELARLCRDYKQLNDAAVRFYEEAFADQPALADNVEQSHRYNAARAAVLAGCGQGKDTGALGDEERARLRRHALTWLRTDLQVWTQRLDKDPDKTHPLVVEKMMIWLGDDSFARVRTPEALDRLPETERAEWRKLWEEVAALRQRAAGPSKPTASDRP